MSTNKENPKINKESVGMEDILFQVEDKIAIVTINRPQALNALNRETLLELKAVTDKIRNSKQIEVVIITGNGEKAFVAGADINSMVDLSTLEGREWGKFGQMVFNAIENLPQPVIAAVNGFCLGGGCELAMACDLRIASDTAQFGTPEVSLGVIPGFGGTQRLPRLVGRTVAKEILYTGNRLNAVEAYRIGLVNKVVPLEELMEAARGIANSIVSRGKIAVQMCKVCVNEGMDCDLDTGLAFEAEAFGVCFSTEDQQEGMRAFIEKRKAKFIGK